MSEPMLVVRWRPGEPREGRVFPPVTPEHGLAGIPCPGCGKDLADGKPITLLAVGPGEDPELQGEHRDGRWYAAVAIPLHAACLGVSL